MKKLFFICIIFNFLSCKSDKKNINVEGPIEKPNSISKTLPLKFHPINHATFVMEWGKEVLYIDPVGDLEHFQDYPKPSLVLITDIHGDHFSLNTLNNLPQTYTIIAPMAVYEQMTEILKSKTSVVENAKQLDINGFNIKAIPMYNLTKERKKFHLKGRGNGYVISKNNYQVYISGDTEDIPEMRKLENIDLAFICMNLPYTMTPEKAADATLEFEPKEVIPYHYRGSKDGEPVYFDVSAFKKIVNEGNKNINVKLLEWYPKL